MTSAVDYDLRLAVRALLRLWWIVLLVPFVALAIQLYQIRTAQYRAEFRAAVVFPGDTDDPGSSERPELMIMDDVPTLISSTIFAERVQVSLAAGGVERDVGEISGALSASRYARTVTVVSRDDDGRVAEAIATSAQDVFAATVNDVLIADGAEPATVTILDPVDGARRGEADQWRVAAIVTVVMVFVGMVAALVVDGLRRPDAVSV